MITVRMRKNVSTRYKTYQKGEIYELTNDLATEFSTLGWASPIQESTALSPARCRAIKTRVTKR